jgi:hypothetical protein
MATRKQRAANRRNAPLSTGPVTPEGKAAVRLNALKHGLTAENATIFDEDDDAFDEFRDTFLDHLQPAGPLETALVHQMVMAQWRLARLRRLETGLFDLGLTDREADIKEEYTNLTSRSRLAYVFRKSTDPLATLGRYEARIERSFYRASTSSSASRPPAGNPTLRPPPKPILPNSPKSLPNPTPIPSPPTTCPH